MGQMITFLVPVLVAAYTFHYARWCTRQKLYRGAAGLYLLAALCIGLPMFVVWWTS